MKNKEEIDLKLVTKEFIQNLTDEESQNLKHIFGLSIDNAPGLDEVAKQFNVTRKKNSSNRG